MTSSASLVDVFRAHSEVLAAKSRAVGAIRHRGLRGTERERILEEFLAPLLPQRLAIGRGEIRASAGTGSHQEDLVVYDALNCPRLHIGAEAQVFPVESVAAVIEVKSRLSSAEIESATSNIARARSLQKAGQASQLTSSALVFRPPTPVMGVLFAYELGMSPKRFGEYWLKIQGSTPPEQRINLVCVLNRFTVIYIDRTFHLWDSAPPSNLDKFHAQDAGRDSLLSFTLTLLRAASEASFAVPNLFKYYFPDDTALEFQPLFQDIKVPR